LYLKVSTTFVIWINLSNIGLKLQTSTIDFRFFNELYIMIFTFRSPCKLYKEITTS